MNEYKSEAYENSFSGFKVFVRELYSSRRIFFILVKNFVFKRYKGSYLGVLWTLMNPVLSMVGLALVFPLLLKFKVNDYVIFLFSGVLAWGLIFGSVVYGSDSIYDNQGLIEKIYIPKIIFPLVTVTGELVNLLFAAAGLHFVMLVFGYDINTSFLYLFFAIVVLYLFCVGVASIVSVAVIYFRDLKHMMSILMQTFFYLSVIIFPIILIPEQYRFYFDFNPFYQYIRLFHQAIYVGVNPDWGLFILPVLLSILTVFVGVLIQYRQDRIIIYRF
ncbi:MAG: ABC transporter permease [Motiliproteus sp.]|nr:ABC transporter permease [Motiliproteus sp.]MCW9053546.1 ABC transporter permease [Motiliproteus sp.]